LDAEKKIIFNKGNYKRTWFKKYLKTLSTYRDAINSVLLIGKCIGDAFVWFFYRSEFNQLKEHLKHERTFHLPNGIGGKGEQEFVNNIRHIQNYFVIYHGITNILRIGDVSLFDLKKFKLVAIGDLKTKLKGDNQLDVDVFFIGPEKMDFKDIPKLKEPIEKPYFDRDRRYRQIKFVSDSFKTIKEKQEDTNVTIEGNYYYSDIEALHQKTRTTKFSLHQVSQGLIIAGIKVRHRTFKHMFLKTTKLNLPKHDSNFVEEVKKILKSDSQQNCIIIGSFMYNSNKKENVTFGSIPLFWFPINNEILKEIYFQKFKIVTIFNPAHIIEEIQGKGINIDSKYANPNNKFDVKQSISIGYFDSFIPYIINHLQNEQSIIEIINQFIKNIILKPNTKGQFNIEINQAIYDWHLKSPSR
jgi:hypothetical protein